MLKCEKNYLISVMHLKLNKAFFSKPSKRTNDYGGYFKELAKGLNKLFSGVMALLTPTLIASSFLAPEMALILANICLALGYLTNYFARSYYGEISLAEQGITAVALLLVVFVGLGIYSIPAVSMSVSMLNFLSGLSGIVNSFFLSANLFMPPLKKWIEDYFEAKGINIRDDYFTIRELTYKEDRFVVGVLARKLHGADTLTPQLKQETVSQMNRVLRRLVQYVNKHEEHLLGDLLYQEKIDKVKTILNDILNEGNLLAVQTFFKEKRYRKQTKTDLLNEAYRSVEQKAPEYNFKFFSNREYKLRKLPTTAFRHRAKETLNTEIVRQKTKLEETETYLSIICPGTRAI